MKSHNLRVVLSTVLLLGASTLVAAPAQPAYSGPGKTEKSISIALADLDLSSEAGIAALYGRLQRAAELVCGPQNLRSAGSVAALRMNRNCYTDALERAVATVAHDALTTLHAT